MEMNQDLFNAKIVPVTAFNKGRASKIFNDLSYEQNTIVMKNNVPIAIIIKAPSAQKS